MAGDIRDDRSEIVIKSDSERGKVFRNSGSFTRGSNLITHQLFMFIGGAKWPIYLCLASILICFLVVGHFWMNSFDMRMVLTKSIYDVALIVGANPATRYNLIIAGGEVHRITFGLIDYDPYVVQALSNVEYTFFLSVVMGLVVTVVPTWLYVEKAISRGDDIMKEHHKRGAILIPPEQLKSAILANNANKLRELTEVKYPGLTVREVFDLPPEQRNANDYPIPYSLAGLPFPLGLELGHLMVVGTGMTGKTTVLSDILKQARYNKHSGVIFDVTGVFTKRFYDPDRDFILNPYDARCVNWSIFHDSHNEVEIKNAAMALIPDMNDGPDPFWPMAARSLFTEMCLKLIEDGDATTDDLIRSLMTADLKSIHEKLQSTIAEPLTSPEAARMAESIRAVFNANADILLSLPQDGKEFSIREWILDDHKDGSFLFISTRFTDIKVTRSLISLWVDTCIYTQMNRRQSSAAKLWIMLDELGALHQLPSLEYGLQTARNFGGAVALGVHDFSQLTQVYGEHGSKKIINMTSNKLFLRVNDAATAEYCSNLIGKREVREMDESYSISNSNARDTSTLTARTEIRPLVLPDEIMTMRNMRGYMKLSDGYPSTAVTIQYVPYVDRQEGFIPNITNNRPRLRKIMEENKASSDSAAPGGGGPVLQRLGMELEEAPKRGPRLVAGLDVEQRAAPQQKSGDEALIEIQPTPVDTGRDLRDSIGTDSRAGASAPMSQADFDALRQMADATATVAHLKGEVPASPSARDELSPTLYLGPDFEP